MGTAIFAPASAGRGLARRDAFLQDGGERRNRVATLNVKNLPDALYRKLQARARREHRSVAQEVIHILSQATAERRRQSLLDLQGLGRDVWAGVDAATHVHEERRSWD
jgi:plasmid stability protein